MSTGLGCAPWWFWDAIAVGMLLVVVLLLTLIWFSLVPARHAAEAAYELREQKAWIERIYGVPAGTTMSDLSDFVKERRRRSDPKGTKP